MGWMIVSVLLSCLSAYLFFRCWRMNGQIDRTTAIVKDIADGNLNRRFLSRHAAQSMVELHTALNRLMERYQETLEKKRYLELSRKRMISNISHDIRTPLTSLLGYIEAVQTDPGLTEAEKQGYLAIAVDKGRSLHALVQDFFMLSKLESEDTAANCCRLELTEVLRRSLAGFYYDFTGCGITPDIQIPDKPVYVWADVSYTERVLANLFANALQYGADGGRIGVALREERDRIWVDIWDRGRGISEKELPHVFDRLFTGEPSRNSELRGSGLGLSIVRMLLEKMQGDIQVTSIPWERTVFSFSLPVCREKDREKM